MKARVKETGEIISLDEKSTVLDTNPCNFNSYEISELEILYENTNFPQDYWTRLEHHYAGMAMQGILSNSEYLRALMHTKHDDYRAHEVVPDVAVRLAHALVEKYKKDKK